MAHVNIAIFTDVWRVSKNPLSFFLLEFAEVANKGKKSVRIFSPKDCPIVIPFGGRLQRRLAISGFLKIYRILKRNSFDGIYIPTPNQPVGIMARIACRIIGLSYSDNVRCPYPDHLRGTLGRAVLGGAGIAECREAASSMQYFMTR